MTQPVFTPWGVADSITEIAPGIISYSTPSHGGIYLSPERVAEMPEPLRNFQPFTKGPEPGRWYEEDADWSIVATAFPRFFDAEAVKAARETIKRWKPQLHAELTGWQGPIPTHASINDKGEVSIGWIKRVEEKDEPETGRGGV